MVPPTPAQDKVSICSMSLSPCPAAESVPGDRVPALPPTLTMYSMRLWECFSITDSIQIKGFTCGEGEGRRSHQVSLY